MTLPQAEQSAPADVLFSTDLARLKLHHRGKVRDVYQLDSEHLLIIATDRLSAFDVVLPTAIPGKGKMLTAIANFWFQRLVDVVPNHLQLATLTLPELALSNAELAQIDDRAVIARKLNPLPIEAIVRGYLVGSGWREYQQTGTVCGISLASDLRLAERLAQPIFTPSTKAVSGAHDENITFQQAIDLCGENLAEQIREISLNLYCQAATYARGRGIIIADTKFEFGLDEYGQLVLMDEILTPDSSRFWPADQYSPGRNPPSFDKQFVRDYLQTLDWNKTAPGPPLPAAIRDETAARYLQAWQRLIHPS